MIVKSAMDDMRPIIDHAAKSNLEKYLWNKGKSPLLPLVALLLFWIIIIFPQWWLKICANLMIFSWISLPSGEIIHMDVPQPLGNFRLLIPLPLRISIDLPWGRGVWILSGTTQFQMKILDQKLTTPYLSQGSYIKIPVSSIFNSTFYSCVLSDLVLDCKRGWGWPCFDTNLTAFHM